MSVVGQQGAVEKMQFCFAYVRRRVLRGQDRSDYCYNEPIGIDDTLVSRVYVCTCDRPSIRPSVSRPSCVRFVFVCDCMAVCICFKLN